MSLTQILEKEAVKPMPIKDCRIMGQREKKIEIYSPKLGKYVSLNLGDAKGDIQEYNVGLGPGSWY